jgi:hypothetical protein
MAKQSLPSVESVSITTEHKADGGSVATRNVTFSETDQQSPDDGYVSEYMIDLQKRADARLTRQQAIELRDKTRKLEDVGATLKDGRPVTSKADAIRWMIEQPLNVN